MVYFAFNVYWGLTRFNWWGIKTTTFGLLIVSLFNTIRGHDRVHVFDRHVKSNLIFKALAILTMSFFIIFFAFFVLLITEPQADFFHYF